MSPAELRSSLRAFLAIDPPPTRVNCVTEGHARRDGYDELRIRFSADGNGEWIPAFLLTPRTESPVGGVLVQHQHAGERQWGKSEVVGLVGNPLQAFGPSLARRGFVVLAPDSICFEDRRVHRQGTEPGEGETDWVHHYNAMAHRLVKGDTLMRQVLKDALTATSLLSQMSELTGLPVGTLGHSYGGNTVLFHAALDERIHFACASGAACSYRHKLAAGTAIEMAEVIPGFAALWDIEDLLRATAPRAVLLVAGAQDPYSADADDLASRAREAYVRHGAAGALSCLRDDGTHAMTQARFDHILDWMSRQAAL